ncbi:hypothetical protein BH10ACT6_BH10ACT6_01520 [soil metagenome]
MAVRRMLPTSRRDREEKYEVTDDLGVVLGWIECWASSRCRVFYRAMVVDRGERISIESSTDFDEIVERIARFADHPEQFEQHRRRGYSDWEPDASRVVHGPSK